MITILFAKLYKQKEKCFFGEEITALSEIDAIKIKEIEAAITFYLDNGLTEDEACKKISNHFDIPNDEIKRILSEKVSHS